MSVRWHWNDRLSLSTANITGTTGTGRCTARLQLLHRPHPSAALSNAASWRALPRNQHSALLDPQHLQGSCCILLLAS